MENIKRRIAIFSGTFNPMHDGHIGIITYFSKKKEYFDELWILPTGGNPLKQQFTEKELEERYKQIEDTFFTINVGNYGVRVMLCDYEIRQPYPVYTIDTLNRMKEKYPDCVFSLIVGGDFYETFDKWKDNVEIINNHKIYVYPRGNSDETYSDWKMHKNLFDMGRIDKENIKMYNISSTEIRENNGK